MYLLLACCKVQLVAQSIPPCSRCCWTINTRFSHDRRWDGACSRDASGRRFPNPSASRARIFCSSWNRLLCSMLVMFLRARCWLVGAFSVHIQPQNELGNHTLELTSHCLTSDWQLKDCDTFCSMAYIFKGHLNNIRKWLFVFENIID